MILKSFEQRSQTPFRFQVILKSFEQRIQTPFRFQVILKSFKQRSQTPFHFQPVPWQMMQMVLWSRTFEDFRSHVTKRCFMVAIATTVLVDGGTRIYKCVYIYTYIYIILYTSIYTVCAVQTVNIYEYSHVDTYEMNLTQTNTIHIETHAQ